MWDIPAVVKTWPTVTVCCGTINFVTPLLSFQRVTCLFVSFTLSDAEGHGDNSVGAGDSIQTADEVRQVVQHTQVVLHHNNIPETHTMIIQLKDAVLDGWSRLSICAEKRFEAS